jgi:plasmid maintenance system antidote protein VapI
MKNNWLFQDKSLARALVQTESVGEFLKAYYQATKAHWPAFSYAWLAQQMDVSKSLLVGIFNGQRRLTAAVCEELLAVLELPATLADYLRHLVELEADPAAQDVIRKKLKKFRLLFLDSLEGSIDPDISLNDPDLPLLYAALGDQEEGASLEQILQRLDWSEERVRFLLKELQLKKFASSTAKDSWRGTKLFIKAIARSQEGWLPKLFFASLKRHLQLAERDFLDRRQLSLVYAICLHQQDYEKMKDELREAVAGIVQKYHDGSGDKIVSVVLGAHKA